jgi:hypothetical protein
MWQYKPEDPNVPLKCCCPPIIVCHVTIQKTVISPTVIYPNFFPVLGFKLTCELYKAFLLQILHPCSISLAGSTPDGQGLHLDVCMTDIRLRVSPGKYKYVACICVMVIVLLN